jgi:multiple sugar transport system ATP-binding protein
MATVIFQNVSKRFGNNEVIRNLSLTVEDGEFVTLVGPSGCGKTTTLRMLAGLEEITAGGIYIDDVLANLVPPQKRDIAMVFQSYALFPHMTVAENIAFGLKLKKSPRDEILAKIDWALDLLNLQKLGGRLPRDLSGGQRQRVALARALVLEPKVLLLDEPLSNLDATLRLRMRAELKRIHRRLKSTILYVTHDQVEAMSLSDRVAVMEEGKLSQVGTPLEVYAKPDNMFVAGFIGSPAINLMPASIRENDGGLVIDLGPCQCAIPEQFRETCRPYRDREVVFGIRPEDIRERGFGPEGCPAGNTVDVVVDVVEPLGDRNIVEVNMAGIALTVLTEASADAKPGRGMTVIFDMDKAHIFDRDTQRNILRFQRAG